MRRTVKPLYLECDRSQIITCWVGIAIFTAMIVWYAAWLLPAFTMGGMALYLLPVTLAIAWFLADLVSGVVHWGTDTWFDEVLSERVISIAREHHLHPHHIVGYGFRDYVAYSTWPALLLLGPPGLIMTLLCGRSALVFHLMVVVEVIAVTMFFGTYAHRLGHRKSDWAIVRFLQRWHFLIDVRHHNVHHRDNHDIQYCVVNGWANIVCDRIGFWRWLERMIYRFTGAIPRDNDHLWFARYQPHSPRRGRYVIGPLGPDGRPTYGNSSGS